MVALTDAPRLVFVPLAGNQARFYVSVARVLAEHGVEAAFLTFHEPSLAHLQGAGFPAISAFRQPISEIRDSADALGVIDQFGIADVNLAISHERAAYEIGDGGRLIVKLARHLEAAFTALKSTAPPGRQVEVVQELGGFLSVMAVFHAARRLRIRNTFIEPSFFRGRVFFSHDTFAAPRPNAPVRELTSNVRDVLSGTLAGKQIVIPDKDRAHYRPAVHKLVRPYNVRRLIEKTVDKYVLGHREEFQHLGGHVSRHVRMAVTAQRLRRWYQEKPSAPYVYYPLHVPADVALTIRAPEYYDQLALIEFLARVVPPTHLLAIKEHPALVGALDYGRVVRLLHRYDNVRILRPSINNHDVLDTADIVLTVNSKSGAEALLRGRRVVALGDSFYREPGLVTVVERLTNLSAVLQQVLQQPPPDRRMVDRFFQRVWDSSWPGELYLDTPENTRLFAASLVHALGIERSAMAKV